MRLVRNGEQPRIPAEARSKPYAQPVLRVRIQRTNQHNNWRRGHRRVSHVVRRIWCVCNGLLEHVGESTKHELRSSGGEQPPSAEHLLAVR